MSKVVIGYKVNKTLRAGEILDSDRGHFEPIYRNKDPLEELAEYAQQYAYLRNDIQLSDRINELIKDLESVPTPKNSNKDNT